MLLTVIIITSMSRMIIANSHVKRKSNQSDEEDGKKYDYNGNVDGSRDDKKLYPAFYCKR